MEVPLHQRRLHGAGPGDRLAADAPAARRPARSRRRCSACWSSPTSATGSAPPVDYREFLFINVELTVHIERAPGRRVDRRRRGDAAAADRGRDRRVGALRPRAAGSAAPRSRCSSARADGAAVQGERDQQRRADARSRRRGRRPPRSRSAPPPGRRSARRGRRRRRRRRCRCPSRRRGRFRRRAPTAISISDGLSSEKAAPIAIPPASATGRLWAKAIASRPAASISVAPIATRAGPRRSGRSPASRRAIDDHRREGGEDGGAVADAAGFEVQDDEGGDRGVADRGEGDRECRAGPPPARSAGAARRGRAAGTGRATRVAISAPSSGSAAAKIQTAR